MKKYLLLSLIIGISLANYSCQNEKEEKLAEEDKEMLMNLSSDMVADIDQMAGSSGMDGLKALIKLMEIQDPLFGSDRKSSAGERYKSLLFPSFGKSTPTKSGSVEGFGFANKVGTYTWSADHQGWNIEQNNPSNKIIIIFPTEGQESETNNAVLTLHELGSQNFQDDWGSWEQPTRLKADLIVDDEKVIEIDLNVVYAGNGVPSAFDLYLLLAPFELSASFEDTGSTFLVAGALGTDGLELLSADLKLDYIIETDPYWGDEETVITFVDGYVHYGSMKITGSIDVLAIDEIENITADELNAYVDLKLETYPGGRKIADVDFIEEVPGDTDTIEPRLTFADGSTALAKDFFKPVADELEAKIEELIEEWASK